LGVKKRKESYEGNEGHEGVKIKGMFWLLYWAVFLKSKWPAILMIAGCWFFMGGR
jgi:hypothetical protein